MANCGCPDDGADPLLSSAPIIRHASSSRSVSRPGSTTAPCGSLAMAAINSAVAGIEPVEPAAITGPSFLRASRAASALIKASRRCIASIQPRSSRTSGHLLRAICKNRSVSCQYLSNSSGTRLSRRSHGTPRVVMSSIKRARSSASAQAAAGVCATSGTPLAPCNSGASAHLLTSSVSKRRRSRPSSVGGSASASAAISPVAASANAISSSSMSPSATMRGRIAASVSITSRNASRASRQARRVGR